jgi:hypothetical protein
MRELSVLVRAYLMKDASRLDSLLQHFAQLQLDQAIRDAALARTQDGSKHSHQQRIEISSLEAAAASLLQVRGRIEQCETFEALYDLICEVTGHVERFGRLARYDTALRIGARLGKMPKLVFLQTGALKGFRALKLRTSEKAVAPGVLPESVQALKPYQIEDFLCIYKEELKTAHW